MDRWNVGILIFDDVEVLDFAWPFEVFSRTRTTPGIEARRSEESAPFRVFTVAKTKAPIVATGGLVVVPAFGFADAPRFRVYSFFLFSSSLTITAGICAALTC